MDSLLEQLKRSLNSAIEGLSADQLRWHPPNKWCTAEILEHLYLSYTGTTKGFERLLEGGKPAASRPSLKQHARAFVVFGFDFLPSGREAPAPTRPKGLPLEKVQSGFAEKIAAMDAIIAQCEKRFGSNAPMIDHPFFGPLTGARWRKFHLLHGLHHQKQILRLRQGMKSD